jgi:hypothetical protein
MNNAIGALTDLNHTLENVLPIGTPRKNPDRSNATALELIVGSVAERYIGEMESDEDRHGAVWYRPSDEEDIREILVDLWGEYLPTMIREKIAEQLIKEGWPELFYLRCLDRLRNFIGD